MLDMQGEQMKIVHKLKNHEDTINCLCWLPANASSDSQALEALFNTADLSTVLCSSSEDKTIRFWAKGEQVKVLKSPGGSASSASRASSDKRNIAYTPLCWPEPRLIISGSFK